MVLQEFRFVEIGRVAFIAYGKEKGKLCVIVDVIDQNRALIDGPCTGVAKQQLNFKSLHLTQFKLNIPRSVRTGTLKKQWEKEKLTEKWEQSTWAKKIAQREKRTSMSDFDRFKLMKAKQSRNRLISREVIKLQKQIKKQPPKVKKIRKRVSKK
ncbi:hypothetical protein ScPMuIL_000590 [Solemya velum]